MNIHVTNFPRPESHLEVMQALKKERRVIVPKPGRKPIDGMQAHQIAMKILENES